MYFDTFCLCLGPTRVNVQFHPLVSKDGHWYIQLQNKPEAVVTEEYL